MMVTILLSIIIGLFVKAYALPIVKYIVTSWTKVYSIFAQEKGDEHRLAVMSDMHEEITELQVAGDTSDVIAFKIFLRWIIGIADDIKWSAPLLSDRISNILLKWSDKLKHFKLSKNIITSIATLSIFNFAFLFSTNDDKIFEWVYMNLVGITISILMSNTHRPIARRIIYSLMFLCAISAAGFLIYFISQNNISVPPTLWITLLAAISIVPLISFLDKSFRNGIFRQHWKIFISIWTTIIAATMMISYIAIGSIEPVLTTWAFTATLITLLIVTCVCSLIIASIICRCIKKAIATGLIVIAKGFQYFQ
jgi:hypothetical protein